MVAKRIKLTHARGALPKEQGEAVAAIKRLIAECQEEIDKVITQFPTDGWKRLDFHDKMKEAQNVACESFIIENV